MKKRLVLGIGTGRCGTKSLVRLLGAQPSASFSHEASPTLPWRVDLDAFRGRMKDFLDRPGKLVGDVAFYYLPYLREFFGSFPEARAVCLKRGKADTVRSFLDWTAGTHRWLADPGPEYRRDGWGRCYPKYDIEDRAEACGRYWDEYYEAVNRLAGEFRGRIRVWDMDRVLNTRAGQRELLSFVGVAEADQRLRLEIRENRGRNEAAAGGAG